VRDVVVEQHAELEVVFTEHAVAHVNLALLIQIQVNHKAGGIGMGVADEFMDG